MFFKKMIYKEIVTVEIFVENLFLLIKLSPSHNSQLICSWSAFFSSLVTACLIHIYWRSFLRFLQARISTYIKSSNVDQSYMHCRDYLLVYME